MADVMDRPRAGEAPGEASGAGAAGAGSAAIEVRDLSKRFRIYAKPWDRAVHWATFGALKKPEEFWALRGVSVSVPSGRCMGIVGANGSGKSTLLKIVTGSLYPTSGSVRVRGRVLSLLELGTGMNPLLTGRENVEHMGKLLLFPAGEVAKRMGEIEAFAELGEFFDRPVRLYSSGMTARLSFSMFACMRPEVLIVDEVLSVGDAEFQGKCAARVRAMVGEGSTILFVSHDLAMVKSLCHGAVWLDHGRVGAEGEAGEVVEKYLAALTGGRGGGG
jgi:ABC-type polysaccharide/polyol phosphate transport system ATPase subunit